MGEEGGARDRVGGRGGVREWRGRGGAGRGREEGRGKGGGGDGGGAGGGGRGGWPQEREMKKGGGMW